MISSSIKSAISDIPFWKKNALAKAVFQFFIVVKPAQQVLADLMRIGNAGRHCPSSFTFSTGSSLKTLDDTNLKLLASPAHSDAQSVWPSHAVRQLLSNLNLAMSSIPVVTHDYIAVGWGEPAQTAIQTCELLFGACSPQDSAPQECPYPENQAHPLGGLLARHFLPLRNSRQEARGTFRTFLFFQPQYQPPIEQLIRVTATLVNEIPDQLASDDLILFDSERISHGKPPQKSPEILRFERLPGSRAAISNSR